ncbi:MAG: hypothetical protein WC839_03080 [Candidatus Paceibacterota bacterium]
MNHLVLKSNTNMAIGNKPMVLLPLDMYEKLIKSLHELSFKNIKIDIKKSHRNILAITSESSLSKDWLKPEEEKVWQNL